MTLSKSEQSLIIALAKADVKNAKLRARLAALEEAAWKVVKAHEENRYPTYNKVEDRITELAALLKAEDE